MASHPSSCHWVLWQRPVVPHVAKWWKYSARPGAQISGLVLEETFIFRFSACLLYTVALKKCWNCWNIKSWESEAGCPQVIPRRKQEKEITNVSMPNSLVRRVRCIHHFCFLSNVNNVCAFFQMWAELLVSVIFFLLTARSVWSEWDFEGGAHHKNKGVTSRG